MSDNDALAEKIRRELRTAIRSTLTDMAKSVQNGTGCPMPDALAYIVAEAQWVEAYYTQHIDAQEAGNEDA